MSTTTQTRAMYAVSIFDSELGKALGAKLVGPKPSVAIAGIFDTPDAFADAILATGAPFSRWDILGRLDDRLFSPLLRRTPDLPTDGDLYASTGKHPEDATDWTLLADVDAPEFHARTAAQPTYVTVEKNCGHRMTMNTRHHIPAIGDQLDCGAACSGSGNRTNFGRPSISLRTVVPSTPDLDPLHA